MRYATPREASQVLQVSEKTLRNWDRDGKLIKEVGSGLNYRRKGLLSLLGQVLSGNVREVVVCHKDRLVRFGIDLIEWSGEQKDCKLVVLNRSDLSPEREMVEDIQAIVHVNRSRLYGLRKYKSAIKEDPSLSRNSIE